MAQRAVQDGDGGRGGSHHSVIGGRRHRRAQLLLLPVVHINFFVLHPKVSF